MSIFTLPLVYTVIKSCVVKYAAQTILFLYFLRTNVVFPVLLVSLNIRGVMLVAKECHQEHGAAIILSSAIDGRVDNAGST